MSRSPGASCASVRPRTRVTRSRWHRGHRRAPRRLGERGCREESWRSRSSADIAFERASESGVPSPSASAASSAVVRPRGCSARRTPVQSMLTNPYPALYPFVTIGSDEALCCRRVEVVVHAFARDLDPTIAANRGLAAPRSASDPPRRTPPRAQSPGPRRSPRPAVPAHPCRGPGGRSRGRVGQVEQSARARSAAVGAHPVQLDVQDGVAPVRRGRPSSRRAPRGPGSTAPGSCTWRCRPPPGRAPAGPVRPPPRQWPWGGRCRWRPP